MNHWLMKSEPDAFSIDDLKARPDATEPWDGVRNYQARNMMRDQMEPGDLAFFYHSNCKVPGIVGIMEIVRGGYPDPTAFDPSNPHFDAKSDPARPRWFMVDVRYVRHTDRVIPLSELKDDPALAALPLVRKGNRLSVMHVSDAAWRHILSMETK
ncbi:EVE domain-containing protein [Desulfatiferula olefinivorans]